MIQYACETIIDLPRAKVLELFDSDENLYKWQRGLKSFEHLSGERGKAGAKSRLIFEMAGRRTEMIETIERNDLPDHLDFVFDARGVRNVNRNRFEEAGPDRTRWISEQAFEFSGLMKLIGFFFKGSFPKQTRQFMQDFKNFAEKGIDVRTLK